MKRILIIEDDPLIADVYRNKLCANGFAVDMADDGASGLDFFRNRKADLVLLDLMLPQINGLEVLKAIRTQFGPQDLPVLVFTNAFLGGMVQQAWEAGANQVLTKATMTPKMIIDMIKNALNNPPPAAVSRPTSARTGGATSNSTCKRDRSFWTQSRKPWPLCGDPSKRSSQRLGTWRTCRNLGKSSLLDRNRHHRGLAADCPDVGGPRSATQRPPKQTGTRDSFGAADHCPGHRYAELSFPIPGRSRVQASSRGSHPGD